MSTSTNTAPSTGATSADIEALASRAQALYYVAKAADDAYHAELARVYGADNAGDARYDYARNAATPQLAELSAAKLAIDSARWRASDELHAAAAADVARLRTVCAVCGVPGIPEPAAHVQPTCANCRLEARS